MMTIIDRLGLRCILSPVSISGGENVYTQLLPHTLGVSCYQGDRGIPG